MRILVASVTALVLVAAPAFAAAPPPLDPSGLELVELSLQACHQTAAHRAAIIAWAGAHHAIPLTDPAALRFYANGPGGSAWSVSGKYNHLILAYRASSEFCAVYAARANPEQLRAYFTNLAQTLQAHGAKIRFGPLVETATPYGRHKTLSFETDTPTATSVSVVLTYSQPGGPYQASLWLRVLPPGIAPFLGQYFGNSPKSGP